MYISVWLWRSDDTELHNAIGIYKEQIESPDPDNSKSEQRWIKQLTWHIHYVFASLHNLGIWNPTAKVSWLHEHHSVLHQSCSVMPGLTNLRTSWCFACHFKNPSSLTSRFSSSKSQRFPVFGGIFEFWDNIWVADIHGSISTIPDDSDHQVWSHLRFATFRQCWINCEDFL